MTRITRRSPRRSNLRLHLPHKESNAAPTLHPFPTPLVFSQLGRSKLFPESEVLGPTGKPSSWRKELPEKVLFTKSL